MVCYGLVWFGYQTLVWFGLVCHAPSTQPSVKSLKCLFLFGTEVMISPKYGNGGGGEVVVSVL